MILFSVNSFYKLYPAGVNRLDAAAWDSNEDEWVVQQVTCCISYAYQ